MLLHLLHNTTQHQDNSIVVSHSLDLVCLYLSTLHAHLVHCGIPPSSAGNEYGFHEHIVGSHYNIQKIYYVHHCAVTPTTTISLYKTCFSQFQYFV